MMKRAGTLLALVARFLPEEEHRVLTHLHDKGHRRELEAALGLSQSRSSAA